MITDSNTITAFGSLPVWQTLGTAVLILSAFFGFGKLLLRSFPKEHTVSFALGTACFMTFFALLPPSRNVLWAAVLPFSCWGIRELFPAIKSSPGRAALVAFLFLAFLGSALLPPYAWDEQTYQLALPLRYLRNSSFAPCPDNPYSFYPALTSWFFANTIALGGMELPRIIVGAITPLLLAALWRVTSQWGKLPAVFAVAALLLSPLFLNMNRAVYVENFIALFTFGGLLAMWKFRKKRYWAPVVCGILAGVSFAVKPTGAVGALLLFLLFMIKPGEWKKWLLFCGTAFIFSFFWYLRTFLYTGNFFYPYSLFPLPGSVEHFHKLMGSARYGLEGITGTALTWLFAGFDKKLFDGIVTGFHLPLLGAAAAAGALCWQKRHPKHARLIYGGAAAFLLPLIIWSTFFPQSRFLLPLLPLAVAAGVRAISLSSHRKTGYCILGGVLLCTLVFQSFQFLRHYYVSWKIFNAVRNAPERALGILTRDPGLFKAFDFLAKATPKDARCLLLMERRGLYCPRSYRIACPGFEPSLTPVPESSEKLLEKLRSFDYIIVGNTTQDVDLQSANAHECKRVFEQLKELIDRGKLKVMPCSGYPVLQVIK